jgi:hypothetical protein
MSGSFPSYDLVNQLESNGTACQKKPKEHQSRALWARHAFARQPPAMDFVPDPDDEAVGGDYSFQGEEQTMDIAEGEDCGRPSEGDDERDESNLFEEKYDLETARVSPILEGVIRHIDDSHSPGNRHAEMTRLWVFELLRTCGSKAFNMVRDQFSGRSRQALSKASFQFPSISLDRFFVGD